MLSRAVVLAVVAVMVAGLAYAADRRQVAEGNPEGVAVHNFMPEGSTRERRSYRDHVFSWNYEKVEVAAEGWKARDFRGKIMPVLLKVFGTVYTTTSAALKVKSYLNKANKFVKQITTENEVFSQCDTEPVNIIGISQCTVNNVVLGTMALSTSVTGAITEAYIRTRLNSTNDKFKLVTDGMFQLMTEAISTELVMLGHLVRMAQKFGSVLAKRYFQSPLPVKGTERDFVKACDNLYAALADFLLMSGMVTDHTHNSIRSEINSTAGLAPEFLKYLEDIVNRGITPEYDNSPFPPLSYYWDMAALEYAVSVLSDINVIANQTLNEVVEESGNDPFHDKAFISNVAYAAGAGLNNTIDHLKRDGLKAALKSATDGLRMAVYAYSEAGLDIPREPGSVALLDNFESFLKSLKQSSVDVDKLGSISGVASVFGVNNNGIEVSYRELFEFFVPTDHDHLMTMIMQISCSVSKTRKGASRFDRFHKLDLLKMAHLVKRHAPNLESSEAFDLDDSAPDVSQQTQIPHFEHSSWADIRHLINLILKPGNVEYLMKMADPVVCQADPKCKETYNKVVTTIRAAMGVEAEEDAGTLLTPSSHSLRGGER